MQVVNGWLIERDGRGFWAMAGGMRIGPFERPQDARTYAYTYPAPKPPRREAAQHATPEATDSTSTK